MTLAGKVSPSKKHWCYSNIVVSPSALELSTTGHGYCSLHLNLPMRGLTVGPYAAPKGEGPDIRFLRLTLHSSGNTLVRSGLPLSVKANDLVLLLRLLQASRDSTNAPPVPVPFHRVGGCSAPENAWLSINRDYAHLTLARSPCPSIQAPIPVCEIKLERRSANKIILLFKIPTEPARSCRCFVMDLSECLYGRNQHVRG